MKYNHCLQMYLQLERLIKPYEIFYQSISITFQMMHKREALTRTHP